MILIFPPINVQVYRSGQAELHPLALQHDPLFLVALAWFQGYLSLAVYHPVPGKFFLARAGMQYPDDGPGTPGIAGQGRDLPIRRHLAVRDAFDDGDYVGGEGHALWLS